MSGVSRVSLPDEFYDRSSDKLLQQPEPQYPLAKLFIDAVGANLPVPAGMGLPGRDVTGVGAEYSSVDRDRLMLAQALPTSLFALGIDFNAAPGGTVRINRPAFANTVYTEPSRKIPVGATITTTGIAVSSEQTNLTLFRYGGPVDTGNSNRVAPYAIEAFDANMGVHKLAGIVGTQLARDYHRFIDSVHVLMGETGTATYPDGMSADNDATVTGSFPVTLEQVSRQEQLMDDANLPTLPDGNRVLMLTPTQWKQLKHDPEYEAQAAFHKEFALLFPNYVGSVGKFHVFKSTTLRAVANSTPVNVQRGMAIAPGAFMGGMGRTPRVASSTDDNYGETAKVIWLSDLAFGLADSRFVYSFRSC